MEEKLLNDYLIAFTKRDNDFKQSEDKKAKEYIDKKKLSIRIINNKWTKFLSIFKKHILIFQQSI